MTQFMFNSFIFEVRSGSQFIIIIINTTTINIPIVKIPRLDT